MGLKQGLDRRVAAPGAGRPEGDEESRTATGRREERRKTRRRPTTLIYLAFGGLLLLSVVAVSVTMGDANSGGQAVKQASSLGLSPATAGRPAPDFTFTLFDGGELTLSSLRGKAVVLNFWASWCPPCKEEAPGLERVWRAYRDKGVAFVGVDIQDAEKDALGFLKEYGITYPNGLDTAKIANSYGITGIPETFLITRDGKIARHWIGPIGERQLSGFVEELLK